MKLKQIEALIAVVNSESISAAAESLSVSQSALTKAIAQFEEELGVTLLERGGGRRARPTAYGEIVYERGSGILANAEEMQRRLAHAKQGFSKIVRIGFGVSVPTRKITQITTMLRDQMPGCSLRLRTGLRRHLLPRLRKQEFDFLISMESPGDEAQDLALDRLWEDRFCIFMSPATKEKFEHYRGNQSLQWLASDRLSELDASVSGFLSDFIPNATFAQIDAYEHTLIKAMLNSGPYISAWPYETFADEVAAGALAVAEIPMRDDQKWRCRVNLISLKGGRKSRSVSVARQLIRKLVFD